MNDAQGYRIMVSKKKYRDGKHYKAAGSRKK